MYDNIVIGIDDSPSSKSALIEASHWIRKHGGELTIVHAVYFNEEEFTVMPSRREQRIEEGKKLCDTSRETVQSEFKIEVDAITSEGEPPDVIVDVARERKADLIALGNNGDSTLKRYIMGTVASGVVMEAPCDVLVVKKPCEACTGTYSSILVPFEGSDSAVKALERACEIAALDGSKVTLLYVIPRFEEMIGFLKTKSIEESLRKEAQAILDKGLAIAQAKNVKADTVITNGHSGEEIVKVSENGYDLIIMGSYGWRGMTKAIMGSTAEHVIAAGNLPVLVARG